MDQESDNEEVEEVIGFEVAEADITPGQFVLVRVMSGKRKPVNYRYVAIVQEVLQDREYNLLGFKSLDTAKKTLEEVKNDLFTAHFDEILAVLPRPLFQISSIAGQSKKYIFSNSVDVFER